ncbi:gliding motility lipoprotein GldB [Marinilabilia salmonicolor]|uniref:gliding motility lipoprotein GldB n=1 Tax=Marinilabilia salmonicolor TaxID=989 RepID=UPI00029AE633|nr:gliding motility protein GldB [Marinilabilia salmonicolor]
MKILQFLFFSALIFSAGCSNLSPAPDVSHIQVNFELIPFYEDLFSIHPDSVAENTSALKEKYGKYLEAYSEGVINVGNPDSKDFAQNMSRFLAYPPNKEVVDTCRKVFSDKKSLKDDLSKAFQYYQYYYPEREVPDVYLHISGFNESMVVDSGWISVSVEKYLGSNCQFYEWLGTQQYLRNRMIPEMVVPDVMKALAMTEYAYNDSIDDLISQMIYHGKMLHFVKRTIPEIPDTLLFGYTTREMNWSRKNEAFMWSTIVEQKHLFSTDPMLIRKYVGEGPFTSFFGQESPGRTGRFLGYQLMKSWLEEHPEASFRDMMSQTDPHRILAKAGYRP